ncbi:MAG: tetratricopeptide repeat protein [Anaerolineae bacterium]|nr:tetratricopeptide repeat protein [Anaerolineae bacterium]
MTEFTAHESPAHDVNALPLMHPGRPVGRDDLLKEIYAHIQARRPVLLYGDSGNGKTALAAALAAAFLQQPGGVLWLASGTHPLQKLLVQVGRALSIDDITTNEQPASRIGAVSTALTTQKPFIVLDNVTDALAPQQFIDKAADNRPLILISDTELAGSWETVRVPTLNDMSAGVLLKQKAGIQDNKYDIDIYAVTKQLGYKVLPIVMAARSMVAAKQTPSDYYNNLKQVVESTGDATLSVIGLTYRALNNALQGLVLMLGATFRGEASLDFLSAISGVPENGILQPMSILSQLYLVEKFERHGKAYYRLHQRVYEFAQAALQGKNQLAGLQKKVLETTLAYAKQNAASGNVNKANLAKEMDNFIAAAMWSSEQGNRETANELVTILTQADDFVQSAGYVYELLALRNMGSGSTAAFPAYGPDPIVEVEASPDDDFYDYDDEFDDGESVLEDKILEDEDDDVFAAAPLDDLDVEEGMNSAALRTDAIIGIDVDQLRQALAQSKSQGDAARTIQILKAIGKVQVGQDKDTEAIATYNEVLETYEEQSDQEGTLDALNMLAALLSKTGNHQAAVMHATRGIQLAGERGDRATELQLQTTLGDARQDLGEISAAIEAFNKALGISRTIGDKQNEALSLYKLGYAHLDNNDVDDAIHNLEQARELFKAQMRRDYEGRVLGGLGSAYSDLEQWSEAIGYYQSALHIAREVQDKDDEMLQLNNLGQAQVHAAKLPDALLSYRQALHLAFTSEKREEIVSGVVDLVRLMLKSHRLLDICDLLLEEAMMLESDDRDVNTLVDEVSAKRQEAQARGIRQAPISGTAQQYAANAYALLER